MFIADETQLFAWVTYLQGYLKRYNLIFRLKGLIIQKFRSLALWWLHCSHFTEDKSCQPSLDTLISFFSCLSTYVFCAAVSAFIAFKADIGFTWSVSWTGALLNQDGRSFSSSVSVQLLCMCSTIIYLEIFIECKTRWLSNSRH